MSGTDVVKVGHKGRIVIPAALRVRHSWAEGTSLIAVDTDSGVILMEREHARAAIRRQLDDADLVAELLSDRRAAAAREDA